MTQGENEKLGPAIIRYPIKDLEIYEVRRDELDALEQGSPESLYQGLCIGSLSTALSFLIALTTTNIESIKTFCVFVILTVLGFLAGAVFGLQWWEGYKSRSSTIRKIRERSSEFPKGELVGDAGGVLGSLE